jgi:hypothetical protein
LVVSGVNILYMDIKKARELIGETNTKYNDEQILQINDSLTTLADIIIDKFLKMTPEERKKFSKPIKH